MGTVSRQVEPENKTRKARNFTRVEDTTFDFWLGLSVFGLDPEHYILDVCNIDIAYVLVCCISCLLHGVG